jgi:phosphoesterase RecJ-like protein
VIQTPSHRLDSARRIAHRLEDADSIAIATHLGGDGDGWGSACAIAHHFPDKDVRLLAGTPFAETFRFLLPAGIEPLPPEEIGFEVLRRADVQLAVDTSERSRLGDFAALYEPERTVVIDHHAVSNNEIGAALTLVDSKAAATVELIYDVLVCTDRLIGPETARALYVGLVTDTGSFRYSNTSPHVHRLAATLIEAGVDPEALYGPLFATATPDELGVLGAALEAIRRDEKVGLTWAVLDRAVHRRFGPLDEYEGIIEHLRNLAGTDIAILFREVEDGKVKVSFRSSGPADVAKVAKTFGGGGHVKWRNVGRSWPGYVLALEGEPRGRYLIVVSRTTACDDGIGRWWLVNGRKKKGRESGSRRRMLVNGITGSSKPDRVLPLGLRLQAIADSVPSSLIDELWVFPPLPNRELACEFLVLICYDGGPERRRILTSHVDAHRADPDSEDFQWVQKLREHGTAPHDWVAGVPDRLLARLSEAGTPEVIEVGGHSEAWEQTLQRFANGNGNGNGTGNGHGQALKGPGHIDNRLATAITFSTIDETETAVSGDGAYTEPE